MSTSTKHSRDGYSVEGAAGRPPRKQQRSEEEEEKPKCIICLSVLSRHAASSKQSTALPCGHVFHTECIDQWIHVNPTCPLCKQPVRPGAVQPRSINLVEMLLDAFPQFPAPVVHPEGRSNQAPVASVTTTHSNQAPVASVTTAAHSNQAPVASVTTAARSNQAPVAPVSHPNQVAPPGKSASDNSHQSSKPSVQSGQSSQSRQSKPSTQSRRPPRQSTRSQRIVPPVDHGYTFDMGGIIIRGPSSGIAQSDQIHAHTVNIGLVGTSVTRVYTSGNVESITIPQSHYPIKVTDDHKIFVGLNQELETAFQLPGFTKIKINSYDQSAGDDGFQQHRGRQSHLARQREELPSDNEPFHIPEEVASFLLTSRRPSLVSSVAIPLVSSAVPPPISFAISSPVSSVVPPPVSSAVPPPISSAVPPPISFAISSPVSSAVSSAVYSSPAIPSVSSAVYYSPVSSMNAPVTDQLSAAHVVSTITPHPSTSMTPTGSGKHHTEIVSGRNSRARPEDSSLTHQRPQPRDEPVKSSIKILPATPQVPIFPVIGPTKVCYYTFRRGPREGQTCGAQVKKGSLRCVQHDKTDNQ